MVRGPDQKSEIIQCGVFRPVITINSFKDESEAINPGSDVTFGLVSSIFTKDVGGAMRDSQLLEFGNVWINEHIPLAS